MDALVNVGAIAYGAMLVLGMFVRHPVIEALRVDAMFLPHADEKSRPLNLLLGLLIAGYGAWSLWSAA